LTGKQKEQNLNDLNKIEASRAEVERWW